VRGILADYGWFDVGHERAAMFYSRNYTGL